MEELAARLVQALVSVRAEIVALGLEQVGRKTFAAIRVVKGQRGAECRDRNALLCGNGNDIAPRALRAFDLAFEEFIEQQVCQLRTILEGFLDLAQKPAAND